MKRADLTSERQGSPGILSAVILGVVIAILPVAAQSDAPTRKSTVEDVIKAVFQPETVTYTAPRTPWGHPDFQGIWGNVQEVWTAFERPDGMAETPGGDVTVDPAVLSDIVRKRHALLATPEYRTSQVDRIFGNLLPGLQRSPYDVVCPTFVEPFMDIHHSLPWHVVDPKDGRLPPMLPDARKRTEDTAKRAREKAALYDGRLGGPEDWALSQRCIFSGWPLMPRAANANYQILQTPTHVVVLTEVAHNARVIPLGDGTPAPASIRQRSGVQRGHWEGEALVVRSTNFSETTSYRGSTADLIVTERFRRIGPDKIDYRFTVEDPKTWPRPFTVAVPLTKDENEHYLYEYMCHEGNDSLSIVLSIARGVEAEMKRTGGR